MRLRLYTSIFLLLLSSTLLVAQQVTVSGKVTSAVDNQSVPGVNIIVKGTTSGTVSDANGLFRVTANSGSDILVFSFIGLETQEVRIDNRSTIDVVMKEDKLQLEEVVISGYREENRRVLPGSVSVIKSDKIQN